MPSDARGGFGTSKQRIRTNSSILTGTYYFSTQGTLKLDMGLFFDPFRANYDANSKMFGNQD